uniref:GP-PDE domain-containing protein n=1 Tax=Bionectria ochroleuca TaxID=29856 RepID=A0A0B7K4J9_BIOOC
MRFGNSLHLWRSYVDYNRLKAFADAESLLPELGEAIRFEIGIVDRFLAFHNVQIKTQFLAFQERWGIRIGHRVLHDCQGVSCTELQDIKVSLLEIADHIAKLESYFRVNQDAVLRILDKAAIKYTNAEVTNIHANFKHPRKGRSALLEVNVTLQHVQEALQKTAEADGESSYRSLLLEQSGFGRFPHRFSPDILRCLHNDDAEELEQALCQHFPDSSEERQEAIVSLVHVATVCGSSSCQMKLLKSLRSSSVKPNAFAPPDCQWIIQHLSRADPPLDSSSATTSFGQILKLLHPSQLDLLHSRDRLGRLPLHYAALSGFDGVCREIISVLQGSAGASPLGKLCLSPDKLNLTPLDYAVQRGYAAVGALLLEVCETPDCLEHLQSTDTTDLLNIAIASRSPDVARLLIKKGWGVRFVGSSGNTILHTVAEQGLAELVRDIAALGVDVDARERVRGWTAITTASVQGHHTVVEALIQSGARAEIPDYRGWLAKDHAAYRGHMKVVDAVKSDGSSKLRSKSHQRLGAVNILPERSASESVIFIHLGTLDLWKGTTPTVDIAPHKGRISPLQVHDTSLELSISLAGSDQKKTVLLPYLLENSDRPWCFTTNDPHNAAVVLKVSNLADKTSIGTGVALVGSLTASLGSKRDTLIRDYNVPLVSDRFGHVGSVVITVVIARPYDGAHSPPQTSQTLALEKSSRLGGHRDVQLTKDSVPVIYHDFLVAEKGSDAPMHTLTYKQFIAISDAQTSSTWHEEPRRRLPWDERERPLALRNTRRMSLCAPLDSATDALTDQMKNTLNYPGYKPNLRHHSIHEPFITLEELFCRLPEDIPLDIELSMFVHSWQMNKLLKRILEYPMLYEAADFQMDNYATEINVFLDTILSVTYARAGNRRIIFTSFSPEICMVLAVKQQLYPILFLNDSSNWPTGDMRATSLQTAMRLAHRFGLRGVAMPSEPFVHSSGLVGLARGQGLYTASYGPLNDDGASVEIQTKAGVDLIIVNQVKLMRQFVDGAKH